MLTPIQNKVVVITGATKGIGKGLSMQFAAHGAKVLMISRNQDAGKQFAKALNAQGYQADHIAADVSSESDLTRAADYAQKHFGQIDFVCANAGIYPDKKLANMSEQEWDSVCNTNLKGTFLTVKTFLPHLKKAEYGRVILTSSITGPITGYSGWSHYGATKAGQLGFMRTAALELAQDNITINAILPGNILTEGLTELGQAYLQKMANAIPLKRLGSIEDIANAALFLASKEAGYITGQTLVVDGGQTLPESLDAMTT